MSLGGVQEPTRQPHLTQVASQEPTDEESLDEEDGDLRPLE